MFATLRGNPLWAAMVVVVAIIGAATVLAWHGTLSGSDFLAVITPIVAGVTGVASAHVAGQATAAALVTPPPVGATPAGSSSPGGTND